MVVELLQSNEKFFVNINVCYYFAFFDDFFAKNHGKYEKGRECFLRKTAERRKGAEIIFAYFRYSASVSAKKEKAFVNNWQLVIYSFL